MADASAPIVIVGAGLAGCLMACFLARSGFRVEVYERRPDPRVKGHVGGRSINLALSARGIDALQRIGLADQVLADGIPMRGRMMHSPSGELTYQPYSKDSSDAIHSVSRGGLNTTLLIAAARFPNVSFHFDHRCESLDLDLPSITFFDEQHRELKTVAARVVIGADGAFSAVRGQMQKIDRFEYSQSYLEHGYKELTIPSAAACGFASDHSRSREFDGFAMQPHALHIWPRGGFMMIALPNQDRTFTCTCFWPFTGPNGLEDLRTPDEVRSYFGRVFPDAVPLMPTLADDYLRNLNGSLVTVRCSPWFHKDKAVILGDAAHAIVPFYGQGMNAAFEDCVALDECIRKHARQGYSLQVDWGAAFAEFFQRRKEHADAIADMALHNFIEMRDHTASRVFLLKKKFEQTVHKLLPGWFKPLYNMISFSTVPYAEAQRIARQQQAALYSALVALVVIIVIVISIVVRAVV